MQYFPITASLLLLLALNQSGFAQITATDQCLANTGEQVWVNAADFVMGDDTVYPEEGPAHRVAVSGFWIDAHEVTNGQFADFVAQTDYVTVAERRPAPADWPGAVPAALLQAGSIVFTPPPPGAQLPNWWSWVPGTSWRHPGGPGSSIAGREHYPVVHVAYEDAQAYAEWAGRALPTEAQFELAARGRRLTGFPWDGNTLAPHGEHHANTWQGQFPEEDHGADGHRGLAPVGCFGANDYGAFDLIGNVWEWTSNWYVPSHNPADIDDPQGPSQQASRSAAADGVSTRVIKGGSYLCAENYCLRFRPAAREAQDTGLGTSHIGFRTVSN